MVDFTNCLVNNFKYYGGKNGGKICIVYNGTDYMLKFPAIRNEEKEEYSNSCISEYIACHILETLGLKVQETILGCYNVNGMQKMVVACRDFTSHGNILIQFAELKNSQIETSKNGYGTELDEVIEAINNQVIYDPKILKEFFFKMFIADALVGNFDRHNGNWGFLINEKLKNISIAPIYDCASCLYPQLTDKDMEKILKDEMELDNRVFVFPTSALKIGDKKINYYNYISSLQNEDCNQALLSLFPKINLDLINKIIDETPGISTIRKTFYKEILLLRYEKILKFSYNKLINNEGK